jgi:hypothetical protein
MYLQSGKSIQINVKEGECMSINAVVAKYEYYKFAYLSTPESISNSII